MMSDLCHGLSQQGSLRRKREKKKKEISPFFAIPAIEAK
jgi:hypothetical protein